mmetsp:Transcript_485/g.1839  ORF Transcript_485/g.1839 Transcript_485/m.1839 type:complete len:283 (+) Transcript_485:761-1609(+)
MRADSVEKVLRVADDHQALAVARQVVLEPHAGLEVKVVGGLVQQQEVVGLHGDHGEHDPRLLPVAQLGDLGVLLPRVKAEAREIRSPELIRALDLARGELLLHERQHGQGRVEHIGRVLVVLAEHQVGVAADSARRGQELARHELQQRAFAAAVRSYQRHARVTVHPQLQVFVQVVLRLATVGEADVAEWQHGWRDLSAVLKAEGERLLELNGLLHSLGLDLLQHLLLRLRRRRYPIGTVHAHERLQLLHVGFLLLVELALHLGVRVDLPHESVVVAAVVLE